MRQVNRQSLAFRNRLRVSPHRHQFKLLRHRIKELADSFDLLAAGHLHRREEIESRGIVAAEEIIVCRSSEISVLVIRHMRRAVAK